MPTSEEIRERRITDLTDELDSGIAYDASVTLQIIGQRLR